MLRRLFHKEDASDASSSSEEEAVELVEWRGIRLQPQKERGIGFQLWPAAVYLCEHLETTWPLPKMANSRVLELGAGLGLVSVAAARLCKHVIATDLPQVVPSLQATLEQNDVPNCVAQALPWGTTDVPKVDVVLAADVVYWAELHAPLLTTLRALVENGAVALVAHTRRWRRDDKFFKQCAKAFDLAVVKETVLRTPPTERRTLHRIYRLRAHSRS